MSVRFISLPVDEVDIKQIASSPQSLRSVEQDLDSLVESIARIGLLQPIVIRNNGEGFVVVAGNRRMAACKKLRWRKIPCYIVELSDKEAFEVSLIENIERKTLDPFEEAKAFQHYVKQTGWGGISELSSCIGRSPAYVSKRVRLLSLPPKVVEEIFRRRKNTSIAEELLTLDVDEQLQVARTLENTPMTIRDVRSLVQTIKRARSLASDDFSDYSKPDKDDDKRRLSIRCIDQVTTALRLALSRMDSVLDKLDKEWVEREILMQYRFSLHGQIDSLIRLKKKMISKDEER